ncbi:MAG: dTMP kinase [Crenarchaeota archaeon]|nr:dTMP kinase [Thermoproteota archaeon]
MKGVYIVVEGIDGAGTTTHARLLVEKLSALGEPVEYVQEPSTGPIGRLIKRLLAEHLYDQEVYALLFAADRLHQYRTRVEGLLAGGVHVVSCRSVVSSLAYQSMDGDELVEWILTLNKYIPLPDVVVYLNVPLEVALARIARRRGVRDVFEKPGFLRELRSRYAEILRLLERCFRVTVIRVDEAPGGLVRSVEDVHREVVVKVLAAINYLRGVWA